MGWSSRDPSNDPFSTRPAHWMQCPRPAFQRPHALRRIRSSDRPLYAQECSALVEHVYESYPGRVAGV